MGAFLSIGGGLLIVLFALYLIRREIHRAVEADRLFRFTKKPTDLDWFERLERLEGQQQEVNASFYELVSALEERMSLVEGSLNEVEEKLSRVENEKVAERVVGKVVERPVDRRLVEIRKLESEGLADYQIAKRLGMGISELWLIKRKEG